MDINERKVSANNGDTSAMMDLAFYFYDQKDYHEALLWAEKAAKKGEKIGISVTRSLASILGEACSSLDVQAYDEAINYWSLVRYWSQHTLQGLSDEGEERNRALADFTISSFKLAYCYWRSGDYDAAIKIKIANKTMESLIHGLCLDKIACRDNNTSLLRTSYQKISVLEHDAAFFNREKSETEEVVFLFAVLSLSVSYRLGIPYYLREDLNRAVYLLSCCANLLTIPSLKRVAEKELAAYKRTASGGWQYIG